MIYEAQKSNIFKILRCFSKLKYVLVICMVLENFLDCITQQIFVRLIHLIKNITSATYFMTIKVLQNFVEPFKLPQHMSILKNSAKSWNYEIFEPHKSSFLRCLMFEKKFVFWISEKTIEDDPHNVHIFQMGDSRTF